MKKIELLKFKYNEHVNNMSSSLADIINQNHFSNHNISKAKWESYYKDNNNHSALLAVDKDYLLATECDYKNYINWLINGNKTR